MPIYNNGWGRRGLEGRGDVQTTISTATIKMIITMMIVIIRVKQDHSSGTNLDSWEPASPIHI